MSDRFDAMMAVFNEYVLDRDEPTSIAEFTAAWERIAPLPVPKRPRPKLPTKWVIASYWAERADLFDVDLENPHCFACGLAGGNPPRPGLASRWNAARLLHRGHLVNRFCHGLDQPQNLVPLCGHCNKMMPTFDGEHAADAIGWVLNGGGPADLQKLLMQGAGKLS